MLSLLEVLGTPGSWETFLPASKYPDSWEIRLRFFLCSNTAYVERFVWQQYVPNTTVLRIKIRNIYPIKLCLSEKPPSLPFLAVSIREGNYSGQKRF